MMEQSVFPAAALAGALVLSPMVVPHAVAETLVAARTLPARTILSPADVSIIEAQIGGAHRRVEDVVGLETRVTLYAGRPVQLGDVGPPALVERNEIVTLRFKSGPLVIETDGRALDRAAAGRGIRVMNLGSRAVVVGRVTSPGIVEVGQ